MTQPMWVDTDSEHLLLNSEVHRQRFRNVLSDPRVTVLIVDPDASHPYLEVRGRVVEPGNGPEAPARIDRLAHNSTALPEDDSEVTRPLLPAVTAGRP